MESRSRGQSSIMLFMWIGLCALFASQVSAQSLAKAPAQMPYYWKDAAGVNFTCNAGWSQRGRNCYRLFTVSQTFFDAQATCNRYGGYLAYIDLFNTSYWLGNLAANSTATDVWIGLYNKNGTTMEWATEYWPTPLSYSLTDQPAGTPNNISYGNWGPNQPSAVSSTGVATWCARMNLALAGHYPWYMESCWRQLPFICQYGACVNGLQFRCNNFLCIDKTLQCNGRDDCGDGSDETTCPSIPSQSCSQSISGQSPLAPTTLSFSSPNPYKALTACMWIIEAPITNTAYITFTSVATEDKYDLVDVYVGGNMISNSRYLLSLSGTPAAATIPTIYSNNNFLIVRLTSDEATQYSGFSAQWSTGIRCDIFKNAGYSWAADPIPLSSSTVASDTACGTLCLNQASCYSATFTTPSTCRLHAAIRLPAVDSLSSYLVKSCPGYAGNTILPNLPVSTVNFATGTWQTVYPPFFAVTPYLHMARTWTITGAQSFSVLSIQVISSDLPNSDSIDIYDGDQTSPLYQIYNTNTGNYYTTTQATARVVWNNAQPVVNRGFAFRYATGCNIDIVADYAEVRTPGYGKSNYPKLVTCVWTFTPVTPSRTYSILFVGPDPPALGTGDAAKLLISNSSQTLYDSSVSNQGLNITHISPGTTTLTFTSTYQATALGFFALISLECPDLAGFSAVGGATNYGILDTLTSIQCPAGYYIQEEEFGQCAGTPNLSPASITCGRGGKWNYVRAPTCVPIYCGPPPSLVNGLLTSVTNYFFSNDSSGNPVSPIATYICNDGFSPSGQTITSTCEATTGTWGPLSSTCTITQCPPLTLTSPLIANKTVDITGANVPVADPTTVPASDPGTIVTFYCPAGYDMLGPAQLVCLSTYSAFPAVLASNPTPAQWNDVTPTCLPKVCALPNLNTALISNTPSPSSQYFIPFGSSATYTCIGTYYLGSATAKTFTQTVTCLATGRLSATPVECTVPSGTGTPASPTTATCASTSNPLGYTFPAVCNAAGSTSTTPTLGPGVCYCICKPGYRGYDCSVFVGNCDTSAWPSGSTYNSAQSTSFCLNGGFCAGAAVPQNQCNCSSATTGFNTAASTALLASGSAGSRCEVATINWCSRNPCINGRCTSFTNGYYCTCNYGWQGVNCTTPINFCAFKPCRNDTSQRCTNATATSCSCTSSLWKGVGCQCKTNLCSPNPCVNNGVCSMPTANTYVCTCPAGYTGINCQTLSACSSLQCSGTGKSGTCIAPGLAGASTAICQCSPGWGGDQCNRPGINWNFDVCFGETVGMMGLWPFKNNVTANKFSFAFWFKTSTAQTHFAAAELTDASSMTSLILFDNNWFNQDTSLVGFTPYDGLWHLVTLVCDGSSGSVSARLYFDSVASTMDYSGVCTTILSTPLIQVTIGEGMDGGCMSLVVAWQNSFSSRDVSYLYNARNGTYPTSTPPTATVIWDWNWGVYAYLYTKGVSRISGSSRGLSSPVPLYQAIFNFCPMSVTYPVIDSDNLIGPGIATPTWEAPTLSNVAVSTYLVYNRAPGAQSLNLGTYPVYYMAKDTWGRYDFCEFYQIVNYGACNVDEKGTGAKIPFSQSVDKQLVSQYLATTQIGACDPNTAYIMPFPKYYTCWELGRYNVDNVYVATTTPMCAVADSGAPNPAPLSVTFGWTYILTSLYTPSLGTFFKTQITNYTLALFTTNPSRNLLQDLGCICTASYVCDPCTASVTTGSDSSNHLTVSITLNGVIDPPALVGGATNPTGADSVSLADALRYEVFVSGLFTNPKVATYLQQVNGANIDDNTFFVKSVAQCSAPDMAAVTTDTPPVNVCVDCSAGTYYNSTTNVCNNCPMYMNQSLANQTSCASCPTGFTTATVASQGCFTICPAGSFYNITAMECEKCPLGWYQPQAGLSYCLPCPDGKSTTMSGAYNQSYCSNVCGAGQEPSATDRSVCSPCKIGSYKSANMTGMCVQCIPITNPSPGMPVGYSTPGNGSISADNCTVVTCPAGTTVNTNTSIDDENKCIACPVGYYQPTDTFLSSVKCQPCPANTTTANNMTSNSSQCVPFCPSGFYVNASLNTTSTFKCLPCPQGTYKNNTYNSTYSIFDTSCTPCDVNKTTAGVGSTDVSACSLVVCDAGQYADGGECLPCPINLYQPERGLQVRCVGVCPAGSFSLTTGNTDLSNCTQFNNSFLLAKIQFTIPWTDSYLKPNSTVYLNLTSRFITILNSQLTARLSSAFIGPVAPLSIIRNGTTVVYAAVQVNQALLVQSVQVPQVALYQAISSAISDAGGFLVNKASLITPTPLPVNSSDLQSLQVAELTNGIDYFCPEGWTFDMTEANATEPCVPCDIGYFQPTGVRLGCMKCTAGYSTQIYASYGNEWDVCQLVCPPGQEYNGTGPNAVCQKCKLGFYKDTQSAAQCTQCPYFVTTAQTGSTSVNQCLGACSAGFYSVWNATVQQPQCVQCPLHTYKVSTTLLSVNCTKCPSGYYTLSTGSTSLSNCIDTCNYPNSTAYCLNRGNCTFNAKNGNATCSCRSPYVGPNCQFQINNCSIGQFNNASAGICQDCPLNTYSDTFNSFSCTRCPGFSITNQTASTSLANCTYVLTNYSAFVYKVKLTIPWNQQYQNKTSPVYWTLRNNIEIIMKNRWQVVLGSMFLSTYVTSFTRGSVIVDLVLVTNNPKLPAGFGPTAWLKNEVALGNGALKDSVSGLNYTADPTFDYPFTGLYENGPNPSYNATVDFPDYLCDDGYYFDFETLECTACKVGTYQPIGVSVSCQACNQSFSTQDEGEHGNEQDVCYVICPPGLQPNQNGFSGRCVSCLSSYYKSDTSASVCDPCPPYTLAIRPSGLTTINDCRKTCDPGYYSYGNDSNPEAGVNCVPCPQGQWKNDTSNAITCTPCKPGNTTLGPGSKAASDCFNVCQLSPKTPYCLNNGFCNITGNTPSCFCPQGFTGSRCQTGSNGGGLGQAIQPWIIAICIIGAIIIIIVLSLIGWCYRRSKENQRRAAAEKADKEIRDLREKQEQAELQAQDDIPLYPFGMMYPQEAMRLGSKRPPSMINTSSYDNNDNNGVRYFTWKA